MDMAAELYARGLQAYQQGDLSQAERWCWQLLGQQPLDPRGIYLLGVVALDQNQPLIALHRLHHATLLAPQEANYHHALGEAWRSLGQSAQATPALQRAVQLAPAHFAARNSLGLAEFDRGLVDEAVTSFRTAIEIRPDYARAHNNLGRALQKQNDLAGAARSFAEAVQHKPDYAIAYNNLGVIQHLLLQFDEAVSALQQALRFQRDYPEAWFNLGNVRQSQGDMPAAVACFREAIRLRPQYTKAYNNLGLALAHLGQGPAARECWQTAVRLQPDYSEAWLNLASDRLQDDDRDGAWHDFQQALEADPQSPEAQAGLIRIREQLCDWSSRDQDYATLWELCTRKMATGDIVPCTPFQALSAPWTPVQQLAIARNHSELLQKSVARMRQQLEQEFALTDPGSAARAARPERLRIGYLSADFHTHATSQLMLSLFGLHDRRRFEVYAYSYGIDDGSHYRRRIQQDCEAFRDLAALSALEAARQIRRDGVHILIELKGYTGHSRPGIAALRPAPVQVSYLGYPGSLGGDFLDYILVDPIVVPADQAAAYTEKLVWLPDSYQVNDHQQPIAEKVFTRDECGLPEQGLVFCCFNNAYKIEPRVFEVWMRLLRELPESVLWLYANTPTIVRNLRREAESRGVSGSRLIFAEHMPKPLHLARQRLADLFLDTLYYNAHTTGSDALWAGLPLLTCLGSTFASRVAASLLTAVGLPELITTNLPEYEQRALALARQPRALQQLREKLAEQRRRCPLFDTARFARHLEAAFEEMWQRHVRGVPPEHFAIPAP